MPEPRPQSIPVFLLVKGAFQTVWRQRDDALRLGLVPTLIYFGALLLGSDAMFAFGDHVRTAGVGQMPPPGVLGTILMTILIGTVAACLMIANWLRFMLLGPMGAVGVGIAIGPPQLSFVVASIVLLFVSGIVGSVAFMPVALLLTGALAGIGAVAIAIAVVVVAVRLSPFLVALAVAQPLTLQQAWAASRGNGISVALALFLAQVPFWVGANLLTGLLGAIGFASAAPVAMLFIIAVFEVASAVVQANVLAAAFRHMVGIKV